MLASASLLAPRSAVAFRGGSSEDKRRWPIEANELTWSNLAITPDGNILFDFLGQIYVGAASGGQASILSPMNSAWESCPVSSDYGLIAFISDEGAEGRQLWTMDQHGRNRRRLPITLRDPASPCWVPNSHLLLATCLDQGLVQVDVRSGESRSLAGADETLTGLSADDRGRLYYARGPGHASRLFELNLSTLAERALSVVDGVAYRPLVSLNGEKLAFVNSDPEGVHLCLLDVRSSRVRRLASGLPPPVDGAMSVRPLDLAPRPAFARDGESIFFSQAGKIARVEIGDASVTAVPLSISVDRHLPSPPRFEVPADRFEARRSAHARWPAFSLQGDIAFSCLGKIWVKRTNSPEPRQLGHAGLGYYPCWNPAGSQIAFSSREIGGKGAIYLLDSDSPANPPIKLVEGIFSALAWSPCGLYIAAIRTLCREHPVTHDLILIDIASGNLRSLAAYEQRSPIVNALGPIVFGLDGHLYVTAPMFPELHLVRVDLGDGSVERFARGPAFIDCFLPSPDLRHIAIVTRTDIYIVATDGIGDDLIELAPPIPKIAAAGGSYVSWINNEILAATGEAVVRYWGIGASERKSADRLDVAVVPVKNARPLLLKGASIVDIDKAATSAVDLIIVDGKIAKIVPRSIDTPRDFPDFDQVDLDGAFLVPGFIDVHDHINYSNFEEYVGGFDVSHWQHEASLAYGITTSFDPQTPTYDVFAAAEMIEAGVLKGPRVASTGAGILFNPYNFNHSPVASLDDALLIAAKLKRAGATMIKTYTQPRVAQRLLVEAAHRLGLGATIEGGLDFETQMTAILDRYDAIEHAITLTPLHQDVIDFIARSGVSLTPTLLVDGQAPPKRVIDWNAHFGGAEKLERFSRPWKTEAYRSDRPGGEDAAPPSRARDMIAIHRAGGRISVGAHGAVPGIGIHLEAWILHDAGMPAHEVLKAMTINGARKIGMDKLTGSLEVGKFADIVALHSNPLKDIRNSSNIRLVIKDGIVFDAKNLDRIKFNQS